MRYSTRQVLVTAERFERHSPIKLATTNEQSKQMGITVAQQRLGSEWNKTTRALNNQVVLNVCLGVYWTMKSSTWRVWLCVEQGGGAMWHTG